MAGNSHTEGRGNVFVEAAKQVPDASVEFAKELWAHPEESLIHAYTTLKTSALMGGVMGYLIPARGPTSLLIAAGLTAPLAWQAGHRLYQAHEDAQKPDADVQALGKALARDTVRGGYDFGLNFAGGYGGAEAGAYLARSKTFIGLPAQKLQRGILYYENKAIVAGVKALRRNSAEPIANSKLPTGTVTTVEGAEVGGALGAEEALIAPKPRIQDLPAWNGSRQIALLMQRAEQFTPETVTVRQAPGAGREFILVNKASFHAHSNGSDGFGGHVKQFTDAEKAGYQVYGMSEHNHANARDGVGKGHSTGASEGKSSFAGLRSYLRSLFSRGEKKAPENAGSHVEAAFDDPVVHGQFKVYGEDMIVGTGKNPKSQTPQVNEAARTGKDPRIEDHAEHPSIVDMPILYAQQRWDAARLTRPGRFVAMVGIEGGRISKGNHIIIPELPELLVATKPQKTLMQRLLFQEPEVKPPTVIEYADGNIKGLLARLRKDNIKDTSGGDPIFILAHPRNKAGDYGEANYRSRSAWVKDLDRNARQIEVISGPALKQGTITDIPSANIHFNRYLDYLDYGLHLSPVAGRDTHFGNVEWPAGTIMMVRHLTSKGVLHSLRERHTGATTRSDTLSGYMTANDKHWMGARLDQAAVPDLNLKMHISGEITPEAQYTVRYWRDNRLADGKKAEIASEVEITGAQLLNQQGIVSFDGISHTLGNRSAHLIEVRRTDPATGAVDKMWTAPIWVEPLSGARHSLYLRWLAGNAPSLLMPSPSPTGG